MEQSELDLVREALTDLVVAHPDDLRAALDEFGWADLVESEEATAVEVLFRLQGEHLTGPTLLDDVVIRALGSTVVTAVALPLPPLAEPGTGIDGLLTRPLAEDETVLVPVAGVDGTVLLAVPARTLAQEPASGMDPRRPWTRVRGTAAGEQLGDAADWLRVRAAGRRALAAELVAIGDRMLALAVEHTSTRRQFGQPLSGFQAVRHKLADVRLAGEVANLAVPAAWEDDDPAASALAKSLAARYTAIAREHVQQVLGGMGFSWEHDLHWYIRRALVLEPLLGGPTALRGEVGETIKESGRLPDLAAL
ncbi:MAG: acyl-CoA dehydrogenase family protein [Sporichthyaceae bacterium]